jgi:ornithine cyclodeaminase
MIILSNADVASLLPMATAIEVVESAMIAVSAGKANLPLRSIMDVGEPNKMGIMPGAMSEPPCFGIKLVSLFPRNPAAGYSSHQGAIVLFESEHGSPTAMMNADLLTAIRTAAASAVATRALACHRASTLAIVGYGEQAEHHLEAMLAVRPIREVRVAGRNPEMAEIFAERARLRYPEVSFNAGSDVQAAVAGAEIICTVTAAAEPILFGDWIAPGTHLNVVGASIPSKREIDEETVAKASVFVDFRPSTFAQAGEVIGGIRSGRISREHVQAEIGEVLARSKRGRRSDDEVTLYRSLGIAAQDLACAAHCQASAQATGAGVRADI